MSNKHRRDYSFSAIASSSALACHGKERSSAYSLASDLRGSALHHPRVTLVHQLFSAEYHLSSRDSRRIYGTYGLRVSPRRFSRAFFETTGSRERGEGEDRWRMHRDGRTGQDRKEIGKESNLVNYSSVETQCKSPSAGRPFPPARLCAPRPFVPPFSLSSLSLSASHTPGLCVAVREKRVSRFFSCETRTEPRREEGGGGMGEVGYSKWIFQGPTSPGPFMGKGAACAPRDGCAHTCMHRRTRHALCMHATKTREERRERTQRTCTRRRRGKYREIFRSRASVQRGAVEKRIVGVVV